MNYHSRRKNFVVLKKLWRKKTKWEFLYIILKREPHLDLEDEADFMESMEKEECLE